MRMLSAAFLLAAFTAHSAADYFPMQVGNTWSYVVYDSTGKRTGVDTMELREKQIGGKPTFVQYEVGRSDDGASGWGEILLKDSGNAVIASSGQWSFTWPYTCAVHSYEGVKGFQGAFDEYWTVKYAGTVKVPAGTFDSCYTIVSDDKDFPWQYWFAPGIGRIKAVGWTSKRSAVLVSAKVNGVAAIRPRPELAIRPLRTGSRPDNLFQLPGNPAGYWVNGRLTP